MTCLHWNRSLPHGPGTCSLGMHGGHPYIGNCTACPHNYPAEAPSDPADRNLLLTYDTQNLGDDIQAVAAADLMPGISGTVLRSHIATTPATGRMFISGWFTTGGAEWPPATGISPIFLSFHAHDPRTVTEHIEYLKAHAPIACRDTATVELCQANGIDAWWAGCVTLTLQSERTPLANAKPLTVDFPIDGVENLTQHIAKHVPHRMALAAARIDRLAQAKCVITSRLHTALPCAALGIPVMLVGEPSDPRFSGLRDLVHFESSPDRERIREFLADPRPNPNAALRQDLANRIRARARSAVGSKQAAGVVAHTKTADPSECGKWTVTSPATALPSLPTPTNWRTSHLDLYNPVTFSSSPERGVLDIEGGIVAREGDVCITADGRVIPDLTWWCGDRRPRMPLPVEHNPPSFLPGKTLLVGSDWAGHNYGHWLMDGIGRLSTLSQAGRSTAEFDHIILRPWPTPDGGIIMDALGLDRSRLVHIPKNGAIQCEQLTVPSIDGVPCVYRDTLPAFMQAAVNARQWWRQRGQRLFIRRNNTRASGRHVPNEKRMEAIAVSLGFKIIDPWQGASIPEFAAASVIVGIHSASLTNIMFCQPGTQVLEIVPTGHQQLYYRSLSSAAGLRYSIMMGESAYPQAGRIFGQFCQSPVHVDLLDFQHALCSLITQP